MAIGKYDIFSAESGAGFGDPERLPEHSTGSLDTQHADLTSAGLEPVAPLTLPVEAITE